MAFHCSSVMPGGGPSGAFLDSCDPLFFWASWALYGWTVGELLGGSFCAHTLIVTHNVIAAHTSFVAFIRFTPWEVYTGVIRAVGRARGRGCSIFCPDHVPNPNPSLGPARSGSTVRARAITLYGADGNAFDDGEAEGVEPGEFRGAVGQQAQAREAQVAEDLAADPE